MRVVSSSRRSGSGNGAHLQVVGVVVTVALAMAAAVVGASVFREMPEVGAAFVVTLLVPFLFTLWAGQAVNGRMVVARLLLCIAAFVVPVAIYLWTT